MAASDQTLASADLASADGDAGRPSNFRPDIEGLRAVAIGLVVLYHAHVPFVPSGFVGVDVFFVISGFLITGLLIREIERTGRVSLSRFYARRAKRLLPATAVVLVVTALLTRLVFPLTQWRDFGGDIVASALYMVNWRFADRSVDYLAEGVQVSPVLHFWSLAVEEQFYLVWPLLLLAVTLVLRRWPAAPVRRTMVGALLLVAVPSFVWSVHLSATSPTAFFVTTTRLWELAVGAFVAIGLARWRRLPVRVAGAIGWLGLSAIAVSAVVFESASAWPGFGALLPTLGSAAVIIGGTAAGTTGPERLLGLRLMVGLGALSYSLYLWHWPMLVFAEEIWGELGWASALAVIFASGALAALSLRFVENPVRFSASIARSPKLALSLGANFSLVGVAAGLVVILAVPSSSGRAEGDALGAHVLTPPVGANGEQGDEGLPQGDAEELWRIDEVDWMTPEPAFATDDIADTRGDGCQARADTAEISTCEYGAADGDVTVAMVGDSKILQWQPALDRIADDQGWRLITYTKSACAFADPSGNEESVEARTCREWNERLFARILEDPPDAIVTSNIRIDPERLEGRWADLMDAGIPVIPLLDNPAPGFEVYQCVAENMTKLSRCSFDRAEGIAASGGPSQLAAARGVGLETIVDLTDVVCPGERCPSVIGNVLVYRQGSHLTRTFVESATEALAGQLVPLIDEPAEGD